MILLHLFACTFQPGGAFATLDGATFEAALEPGAARDLSTGDALIFLTDLAYEVTVERADVGVESVDILTLQASGGAFDPANPPDGFTLCHGGHCHDEGGALWSYAEVEAFMATGGGGFSTVVGMPVDASLDLVHPEARAVAPDTSDLPMGPLDRLEVGWTTFVLEGTAVGGALVGPTPVRVEVALPDAVGVDLGYDVGRTGPEALTLAARLAVPGTLFDGVDLATLVVDGAVDLTATDAAQGVIDHLLESVVTAELTDVATGTVITEEEP